MVLELAVCQSLLLLQSDLYHLKWCHNQQRLSDTSGKASCHAPAITQMAIVVTQQTLRSETVQYSTWLGRTQLATSEPCS
jgi:hypothetical protein